MNSVGDKSKEATAFLKSIMDADDADLGKAATKAEWQHSIIPTSQIISIAAQAEPCQKLPHSSGGECYYRFLRCRGRPPLAYHLRLTAPAAGGERRRQAETNSSTAGKGPWAGLVSKEQPKESGLY